MIRYLILRVWFCLFLVFLMTLVQPFAVFADVMTPSNAFVVNPDYLIGSASNADSYGIATMELTDGDYDIQPFSTLGTVGNTIQSSTVDVNILLVNPSTEHSYTFNTEGSWSASDARYHFNFVAPSGYIITYLEFPLFKYQLPVPGSYAFSFDYTSDFSYDYTGGNLWFSKSYKNASSESGFLNADSNFEYFSGDIYFKPYNINISNIDIFTLYSDVSASEDLRQLGGSFAFHFEPIASDPSAPSTGLDTSEYDFQQDLNNSIGSISSSLDSAAENLEYISTSQNLIIQGIDNVIMHISDQLYAFWDQLYNLIHEPTYARLEQILLALKAIANNSDISAVVDTIEETTQQQISNDNTNTGKVESAVEKHGNFIIEGLKSLFIPSDEYFKTYFDDLYSYFSDRFGFLSFPIDLLVRLVDLFANSSERDCILTLPSFEISGEQLITEASFNLTEFMENDFSLVLSSIRMVTSIYLIMEFVSLCQTKWNEVMRN